LQVGGLLVGGIIRLKLESITFPQAPQSFTVKDLKCVVELKQDKVIQERDPRIIAYDA
jgi:hypothetical protein